MSETQRIEIIYEDDSILVVNKPAGLATQAPRQFDSLEARIRNYLASITPPDRRAYLGIPHRLDRCVSGVMVFAKRIKAAQRLSKQFERRQVKKTYAAWVGGQVTEASGHWRDWLRKIPGQPRAEVVSEQHPDARLAILNYALERTAQRASLLSIQLETGRMHQIRIQAASRGLPVIGDIQYGSPVHFGPPIEHERERCIALHAARLQFNHPRSREDVEFMAEPSSDWTNPELRIK